MNLTYVTSNYGKYIRAKERFEKKSVSVGCFNIELDEPEVNDIRFISKAKAKQAYELVKSPVFVTDNGFYIENYPGFPGYPGAFAKRSGISSDVDNLLEVMKDVDDRSCYFLECLTYYDGENYEQFFGKSSGVLAYERRGAESEKAMSNLWQVFIPDNYTKTLAEMTDEERLNRNDNRTSAIDDFLDWYRKKYVKYETRSRKIIKC